MEYLFRLSKHGNMLNKFSFLGFRGYHDGNENDGNEKSTSFLLFTFIYKAIFGKTKGKYITLQY